MPIKDLYYEKYLKYKNKYLNLQNQIGGSPSVVFKSSDIRNVREQLSEKRKALTQRALTQRALTQRALTQRALRTARIEERKKERDIRKEPTPTTQPPTYISCQGTEGTCWAHATTRLFIKLMLTCLYKELTIFLSKISNIDCNYYYDIIKCGNSTTTIFDCFLQIKKGNINCDSQKSDNNEIEWPKENVYALLFHFIFLTLVEQFGRENGAFIITTLLYILDYLKYIEITKDLIKTRLGYSSIYNEGAHSLYFNTLINDLNDFFMIIKDNLNKKLFDPIIYTYDSKLKKIETIYYYYYTTKEFECNKNDFIEKETYRLSFKEKLEQNISFSSKIENLNPIFKDKHNLKKLTNTTNLLQNIIYVLKNNYYVLFITEKHVIIITHYTENDNDTFLHIKNSWDTQSCKKTEKWCNLIKDDRISMKSLSTYTSQYEFTFFYPYTFTEEQHKIIEKMNVQENTQLIFKKGEINNDEIKAIVYGLIRTTVLIVLILSDYNIGDIETIAIADALVINRTLQTLNLSHNNIGNDGAKAIAYALIENITLTTLNLDKNMIYDEGCIAIGDALLVNNKLTTLSLIANYFTFKACQIIRNTLKYNKILQNLNLSHNNIGDLGANEIAEGLKKSNLQTLDLGENNIGDDGAKAIAEALKTNTTLTTLNLSHNNIGNLGAKQIAEALKTNTTLKTLDFARNIIGNNGARTIAEASKTNTILEKIILDNNRNITPNTIISISTSYSKIKFN